MAVWRSRGKTPIAVGTPVEVSLEGEHARATVVEIGAVPGQGTELVLRFDPEIPRLWRAGQSGWVVWPAHRGREIWRQAWQLSAVEGNQGRGLLVGSASLGKLRSTRVALSLPIMFARTSEPVREGITRDISESGARFWTPYEVTVGSRYHCTLRFRTEEFPVLARVVRSQRTGKRWDVAVCFEEMSPQQQRELRAVLERARLV